MSQVTDWDARGQVQPVPLGMPQGPVQPISPPAQVAVPSVAGITRTDATTAILAAGLVVGTVTDAAAAADTTVAIGCVISENPVAGTLVAPGSAVDLVVSQVPGAFQVGPGAADPRLQQGVAPAARPDYPTLPRPAASSVYPDQTTVPAGSPVPAGAPVPFPANGPGRPPAFRG